MDSVTIQLLGGCISAIIPMLFVARMVREVNSRRIILYFCWGVFASLLSYGGNMFFGAAQDSLERVARSVAPIIEEVCKGLPVLLFLRKIKHPRITGQIVYCALASGVGFSILESIYYFSISTGSTIDVILLIIRALTTTLMHGMSTAVLGIGLLILQKQRHILLPSVFSLFALSACIHALFNLLLPTRLAALAMLMPIGLYFAGLIFMKNEGDENNGHETEIQTE